jgi:hypothetical protein
MRYRFVNEIVSLALDGAPRIEVAKRFEPGNDVFGGPQGPARVPDSMLLELMAMTGGQLIAVATLRGLAPVADGSSVGETDAEVYVERAPIARARLMFVCVEPPGLDAPDVEALGVEPSGVDPTRGPSA